VSAFWLALIIIGAVLVGFVLVAVFERLLLPLDLLRSFQRRLVNPSFRWAAGMVPGYVLVETVGRRSGLPRRVPVGGGLRGSSVWVVAGDGRAAAFVRNIETNPAVRVRVHGRWRRGTANVLVDDNAYRRLWRANPLNGLFMSIAGRNPLTIRIDL
jgi:deazaflavin-dependent oxidoreductase (nitroreductase family)